MTLATQSLFDKVGQAITGLTLQITDLGTTNQVLLHAVHYI